MLDLIFNLTSSDPLQKMLVDTPMEIITVGARNGTKAVAEYVKGTALINAPWDEGTLANAHTVYEPSRLNHVQRERGVLASHRVRVPRQTFGEYYYPIAMEFGWDDAPQGFPWLRRSLYDSQDEAFSIYRREMAAAITQGKGAAVNV